MNDIREIRIDDFDYDLPDGKIAKHPLKQRDACKLLMRSVGGEVSTHIFNELPELLPDNSILVYNNTRVINARLRFSKGGPGGASIEIFCLEPSGPSDYERCFASTESCEWVCFVGNSKRWKSGSLEICLNIGSEKVRLSAERVERMGYASVIRFSWNGGVSFSRIIEMAGEIPIPPYLNRSTEATDTTDYQTVFSHVEGSVAAPTAGLHFTDDLLERLDASGIRRREVTLHVGAGTFQPVKTADIGHHGMHSEFFAVSRRLIGELSAIDEKGYVVAVGTTSVRTLESLYHAGCLVHSGMWDGEVGQWYPYESNHPRLTVSQSMAVLLEWLDRHGRDTFIGTTRLMIAPGYKYNIVKGMVTNFHQPRSTLLLLVCAMIGNDWKRVYEYALDREYRFLSYGDACLFLS